MRKIYDGNVNFKNFINFKKLRKLKNYIDRNNIGEACFQYGHQQEGVGLFRKKTSKKSCHNKNYCYFYKSNIPVINLILGFRNMIKVSKNMSL